MKTVIITGTSSGIGLELVKIFDSKGFNVISLSRNNLPNSLNFSENVTKYGFGEDQLFFSQLFKLGETIKWNNNPVFEIVQKNCPKMAKIGVF